MTALTEPRSGIKYGWALGESGWNVGMDANLLQIGRFGFHLSVKDKDLAAPPASPAAGDAYIVAASPTGAWAGKAAQIAVYDGSAWVFGVPRAGWLANVEDEDVLYKRGASAWVALQTATGVGASLNTVNVYTKNQSVAASVLTSGASIAVDAALTNNFKVVLSSSNATLVNPTNLTEGMVLNFTIDQDAAGSRTLNYGSLYKFSGGVVPVLSTAGSAKDFMSCYYDGVVLRCQMNKGFA